jgi:hypothetical protein
MTIQYLGGRRISGLSSDTKPTNVQTGSRFEETDTRNILIKDDVGWKDIYDKDLSNFRSESWYEQLSGETP